MNPNIVISHLLITTAHWLPIYSHIGDRSLANYRIGVHCTVARGNKG